MKSERKSATYSLPGFPHGLGKIRLTEASKQALRNANPQPISSPEELAQTPDIKKNQNQGFIIIIWKNKTNGETQFSAVPVFNQNDGFKHPTFTQDDVDRILNVDIEDLTPEEIQQREAFINENRPYLFHDEQSNKWFAYYIVTLEKRGGNTGSAHSGSDALLDYIHAGEKMLGMAFTIGGGFKLYGNRETRFSKSPPDAEPFYEFVMRSGNLNPHSVIYDEEKLLLLRHAILRYLKLNNISLQDLLLDKNHFKTFLDEMMSHMLQKDDDYDFWWLIRECHPELTSSIFDSVKDEILSYAFSEEKINGLQSLSTWSELCVRPGLTEENKQRQELYSEIDNLSLQEKIVVLALQMFISLSISTHKYPDNLAPDMTHRYDTVEKAIYYIEQNAARLADQTQKSSNDIIKEHLSSIWELIDECGMSEHIIKNMIDTDPRLFSQVFKLIGKEQDAKKIFLDPYYNPEIYNLLIEHPRTLKELVELGLLDANSEIMGMTLLQQALNYVNYISRDEYRSYIEVLSQQVSTFKNESTFFLCLLALNQKEQIKIFIQEQGLNHVSTAAFDWMIFHKDSEMLNTILQNPDLFIHFSDIEKVNILQDVMKHAPDLIEQFLECASFKNVINTHHPEFESLLHLAVYLKNSKLVATLIKEGANIDAQDKDGKTPLVLARELQKKEASSKKSASMMSAVIAVFYNSKIANDVKPNFRI